MSSCDDRWECQAQIIDQVRAIYYGIWDGSQTGRQDTPLGREGGKRVEFPQQQEGHDFSLGL